jgi:hypothetical protein
MRENSDPGEKCVRNQPLVDKDKILLLQIREVINDDLSEHLLMETKKSAWLTLKKGCLNFLGNIKAANCKEFVEDLLNACQTMGCNSFIFNIPTWTSHFRTWVQ